MRLCSLHKPLPRRWAAAAVAELLERHLGEGELAGATVATCVKPTPATHAISTVLKAGETVYLVYKVCNTLYRVKKTLSDTT